MKKLSKKLTAAFLMLLMLLTNVYEAVACTRFMYKGTNGLIITGRSMDWKDDIKSNLWIFPRGIKRTGETNPNSLSWTSKYGSVITSAFDIATCDGMNEKGLVANLNWLAESEYPVWDKKKPGVAISLWTQYVLDNFATVKDAVAQFEKKEFEIVSDYLPGTKLYASLHLAISDSTGDNAVFEFIKGKLVIHHDPSYTVMTNSPIFEQQLALNEYWKNIGGLAMLPGTNRAADRFVRASFYVEAIPKTDNTRIAVASVFSVIRNCSVPFGISTPNEPNISSTRWRSVADIKNRQYYFETALTPNVFWVDFKTVDFSEKAPIKKLNITNNETYSGNAAGQFVNTPSFKFQGL